MNLNPIDLRERLAQLPRLTQRFWTWLTGLARQHEPPRLPWTVQQHLLAYFGTAGMAIGLAAWSAQTLCGIAHGLPI